MAQNNKTVRLTPDVVPGGQDETNTLRVIQQALNRNVAPNVTNVTNVTNTYPTAGVTDLNTLVGAVLLAGADNVVITVASNTITIEGRIGPRLGYRWPSAGQNITILDDDYGIYGTAGQHCNNVTFPLASSMPGKVVRFTYPPGGSLIASGGDTIDAYSGQTAEYQSDGVSVWRRMWNV
jgi:hypothetical protein